MPTTFNISGHHVEVTAALEDYIRRKLSKVEQMFSKVITVRVIVSVEKFRHTAEAEIRVAGDKNSIFATVTSDDLYKSIDMLEAKLLVQVKKYHDKLKDH